MSRVKEAVLAKGTAYAGATPTMNLSLGGRNYLPTLGRVGVDGVSYDEYINNQSYVNRNSIIPMVITYPRALDYMPDKEHWIAAYKNMMEIHPTTIQGFNSGVSVEFGEEALAGTDEVQSTILGTRGSRTDITIEYREREQKAIQKFLHKLIAYVYADHYTGKPLISDLLTDAQLQEIGSIYSADFTSGTTMYVEADVLQRTVVDAWLCVGQMFKGNGDRVGGLDRNSVGTTVDHSIGLTSITYNTDGVLELGQSMLDDLKVLRSNPDKDLILPESIIRPSILNSGTGFNK